MTVFASSAFQGGHAALDGDTLVLSVWGSDIAGTSAPQTLADLAAAGTESTAPGYTRLTFEVEWSTVDLRLRIVAGDQWPQTDLDGDNDVRVLVVSTQGATDADRDVVTMEVLPTAVTGYDGWVYQPNQGLVGYVDAEDVDTRLDQVEARTVAGVTAVDGNYPAADLRTAIGVTPPGSSSTWGDGGGTAYVDRDRVWLDGNIGLTSGSSAVGTLPAGKRPAATVWIPTTFINDIGGTPAACAGLLSVTSAGVATLSAAGVTLTGDISVPLTGLSFRVAS